MKRMTLLVMALATVLSLSAKKEKTQYTDSLGNPIKVGWNFGAIPSVGYDADLGFQGGVVGNIYYYGDGSRYPEYIHSLYAEATYSTKRYGIFRLNYDANFIPNHRLTVDLTYLPDAMSDFYGYNGYQSQYNQWWHTWNKDPENTKKWHPDSYRTRAFYKYKRDMIRVSADIEGQIAHGLKWNAGIGVLGYLIGDCDVAMLNGKKHPYSEDANGKPTDHKAMNPSEEGLFAKYQRWGLMSAAEAHGGWHPYVRAGLTYDTRDARSNPSRGIYTDAFFTYTAAFGEQAHEGFNNLRFNFNFRHYVPVYGNRVVFAYRLGTQNVIAGRSPFYLNTYQNTLFIQRVMYEALGGGNSLRGVMRNRALSNGYAFANIEFRLRVVDFDLIRQHFFIALNPFFDMGMITQPYALDEENLRSQIKADGEVVDDYFHFGTASRIYYPHMAAGLGLKIGMNENFILSFDWAAALNNTSNSDNPDGKISNFYVKMGYLF